MNNPHVLPIETIEEWLVIATDGLVPVARQRIKMEINAHYAELVATRTAEGMKPKDAESAALLALGDASAAGKSFRKKHLTEVELRKLQKWIETENAKSRADFLIGDLWAPVFACLAWWMPWGGPDKFWFRPWWFAVLGAVAGTLCLAMRMKSRSLLKNGPIDDLLLRRIFLLELASGLSISICWLFVIPISVIRIAVIPVMAGACCLLYLYRRPVWRKLGDLKPAQNA